MSKVNKSKKKLDPKRLTEADVKSICFKILYYAEGSTFSNAVRVIEDTTDDILAYTMADSDKSNIMLRYTNITTLLEDFSLEDALLVLDFAKLLLLNCNTVNFDNYLFPNLVPSIQNKTWVYKDAGIQEISECPKCDNQKIGGLDNFCHRCGNDLREYEIKQPCCGAVMMINPNGPNKYCPRCGELICYLKKTSLLEKEIKCHQ